MLTATSTYSRPLILSLDPSLSLPTWKLRKLDSVVRLVQEEEEKEQKTRVTEHRRSSRRKATNGEVTSASFSTNHAYISRRFHELSAS